MKGPSGGKLTPRRFPCTSLESIVRAKSLRGGWSLFLELLSETSVGLWHRNTVRSLKCLHTRNSLRPACNRRAWKGPPDLSIFLHVPRGHLETSWPGQNRQIVAFSFFHFFIVAHSGVFERKKTAASAAKPCLLEGKERGGGSLPLQQPASGPAPTRRPRCGFQRGTLTHAAPVFIYSRTSAGAAGAAPSPRTPLGARGAVRRDPTGASAPGPAPPARQLRGYN